jgi:hypothetical protein
MSDEKKDDGENDNDEQMVARVMTQFLIMIRARMVIGLIMTTKMMTMKIMIMMTMIVMIIATMVNTKMIIK